MIKDGEDKQGLQTTTNLGLPFEDAQAVKYTNQQDSERLSTCIE